MVNKGRIHGEIMDFQEIFWNSIKSADELVIEITRFGLVFVEKSKSETERNFLTRLREKN